MCAGKVAEQFPPIQGARLTRWLGLAAPLLLPTIFIAVWLWLGSRGRVH